MNDKELIKGGIEIKPYFQERFFPVETLMEQIMKQKDKEIDEFRNVERKRQLIRMDKEKLVDMVFNLESRNETLIHNLSEVEKMYDKLKGGVDELETEVFSLLNQNKLWQCIVEDYKKKEKEEKENG